MNYYHKLLASIFFFLTSSLALCGDFPKALLDSGNLEKIRRELSITQDWRTAKVEKNEYIIPYLIRTKNTKVLLALVELDMEILFDDIIQAAKVFFDIDIKQKSNPLGFFFPSVAKFIPFPDTPCEKIIALANNAKNREDIIEHLAPVLNMLFEPNEIVETLAGLYWAGLIDQRGFNIFAYYGDDIFMNQNTVSIKSVIKFVDNFYAEGACFVSLFKLMVSSYEASIAHKPVVLHNIAQSGKSRFNRVEQMVYGLTELSRERFLELSVQDLMTGFYDRLDHKKIKQWLDFNQALKKYIVHDIVLAPHERAKVTAFEFWSQVADLLIKNENFSDAEVVRVALETSFSEVSHLKVTRYPSTNLTGKAAHKHWYQQIDLKAFHIPSISIILNHSKETILQSILKEKTFDLMTIKELHRLKKIFLATKLNLSRTTFYASDNLMTMLRNLGEKSVKKDEQLR